MTDSRLVADRCHHRTSANNGDLLRRYEYVCQFVAGHRGMHYSAVTWHDSSEHSQDPPQRWGTEDQFQEELRMRDEQHCYPTDRGLHDLRPTGAKEGF